MQAAQRPAILLVDDDPQFVKLAVMAFAQDWDVTAVSTLRSALVLLEGQAQSYVGVVLDLNLPDSRELTTLFSVLDVCGDLPILAVTAQTGLRRTRKEYAIVEKTDIDWASFGECIRKFFLRETAQSAEEKGSGGE